jgi:hypothetical protein
MEIILESEEERAERETHERRVSIAQAIARETGSTPVAGYVAGAIQALTGRVPHSQFSAREHQALRMAEENPEAAAALADYHGLTPEAATQYVHHIRTEEARLRSAFVTTGVRHRLGQVLNAGREILNVLGYGAAQGAQVAGRAALEGGRGALAIADVGARGAARGALAIADASSGAASGAAGLAGQALVATRDMATRRTLELANAAARHAHTIPRQVGRLTGELATLLGDNAGGLRMILGGNADMAMRELTDLGRAIQQREVRRPELTPFALTQGGGGLFSQGTPFITMDTSGTTVDTLGRHSEYQPARRRRSGHGAIAIA